MVDIIRRVVTGTDVDGKSIYTDVSEVEGTTTKLYPGTSHFLVWGTDDGGIKVGKNDEHVSKPFFPGSGGSRLIATRFAPMAAAGSAAAETRSDAELAEMRAEAAEKIPGLFDVHFVEGENSAFHTTDTIDYGFVVEGELWLELDDGREERLTPGTFVIQRGTRHAWINRSDKPALAVYVLLGADRVD